MSWLFKVWINLDPNCDTEILTLLGNNYILVIVLYNKFMRIIFISLIDSKYVTPQYDTKPLQCWFFVMPQNEELSSRHVQAQSSLDGAFQIELSRLLINIGQWRMYVPIYRRTSRYLFKNIVKLDNVPTRSLPINISILNVPRLRVDLRKAYLWLPYINV